MCEFPYPAHSLEGRVLEPPEIKQILFSGQSWVTSALKKNDTGL